MNVQVDFLSRIFYILSKDYQNIDLLRNFLSEVKKYNLDVSDEVYKLFISKCPQYEILIMKYYLQDFDFQSLNEIIDYYYIYKHYYFRSKSFRESFDLLNYYLKLYEILIFALTTNKVKARAIKFICQNYAKIEDIYYLYSSLISPLSKEEFDKVICSYTYIQLKDMVRLHEEYPSTNDISFLLKIKKYVEPKKGLSLPIDFYNFFPDILNIHGEVKIKIINEIILTTLTSLQINFLEEYLGNKCQQKAETNYFFDKILKKIFKVYKNIYIPESDIAAYFFDVPELDKKTKLIIIDIIIAATLTCEEKVLLEDYLSDKLNKDQRNKVVKSIFKKLMISYEKHFNDKKLEDYFFHVKGMRKNKKQEIIDYLFNTILSEREKDLLNKFLNDNLISFDDEYLLVLDVIKKLQELYKDHLANFKNSLSNTTKDHSLDVLKELIDYENLQLDDEIKEKIKFIGRNKCILLIEQLKIIELLYRERGYDKESYLLFLNQSFVNITGREKINIVNIILHYIREAYRSLNIDIPPIIQVRKRKNAKYKEN